MESSLLVKIKQFLKQNPGALFVLGFQASLVACAILLIFGLSFLAEGVAVAAYFLLVTGVILQLAYFARESHG